MLKRVTSACFLMLAVGLWPSSASADVPEWLRSVAKEPAKTYASDVNAVILFNSQETTVKDSGEIFTRERIAYRVLRPEGKDVTGLALPFSNETKITFFRGWSITAKGQEYETKDKDTFERTATDSGEIFSDTKEKIMMVPGGDIGTVVGFEYEQKERPYVFQDSWSFQRRLPVEHARYELRLPATWEYRADWVNHPEKAPVEQNGSRVWELSDIPRIENEYNRPPDRALEGHVIVTFFSEKIKNQTYKNWSDFGTWWSQLASGTRDASPPLQQKVQELAPANLPVFERIQALARFAQRDIRYAAIEMGIGGYRPHPAAETFTHRYGDCKDKATILGSMLAQIGVKSYFMPIHDKRGMVTQKSPPNLGFNHAIIAIEIPDSSPAKSLPAIYEHPKLGHLLIFDPTNDQVPIGQIPSYEQDSYALLVTDSGGELIHLPVSKPELNRLTRTAKLNLLPDGTLKGEVEEIHSGSDAADFRARFSRETEADRKKALEHFLSHTVGNFHLDSIDAENLDNIDRDLVVRYKFTAEHYAKTTGPLLLVRPRVMGEKMGALDANKPRHYAYDFDVPTLQTDTFEINLPDGYKVDELPDPAKASYPFGEYHSKIENSGNVLKYTREYKITTTQIPVETVGDLGRFFYQINMDERNMAVLKKGN
ncbi:MAG TPA: DUF3857 domain-containing protein [Candidatus Angelobacter sp.]|nr:DUF3857 domain-containing protein [Candidatus Angelobacter sp.]